MTIPESFYVLTKILPDSVFIHTKERLWRRHLCDGAELGRADLESGALHIGEVLCHTLVGVLWRSVNIYWVL